MLHRAVLGSIERFIAILLEHTAGRLPLWLAPEQVRVLPVSEKVADYGARVAACARGRGLRAECDARNEKLGYKVREAQLQKVPAVVVVGEREAAAGTVAPRLGPGEGEELSLEAYVERAVAAAQVPGGAS
jgi:threonyl-tRNA synthetase